MTDITELAQRMRIAATMASQGAWSYARSGFNSIVRTSANLPSGGASRVVLCKLFQSEWRGELKTAQDAQFIALANPANVLALVEALEKAQQRNAELEAQNDYFASLVAMARVSADKAIRKFPQPNYVLLKVAEEAGEVVQAGVHYAENRMEWGQVEGEIVQLLAMLIRLVTEGDQVNGITPPASCSAGIKVEDE
ncbi:ead/Ea22-like family protein [Klebsiella sp. GG_Kp170]|uniref:ead/Ea22-like family protein n=1 Tax=Klebsiella sp. GG_Kp170 TaxID=3153481 RepID=UPI0032B4293C